MRYAKGGVEAWVNIGVGEPPNTGMSVIEVAPLPISLTLATPATMPEKVTPEKGDFPYLTPIAGSKFKGGHLDPAPYTVMLTGANQPEIVATGMINKNYQPPEGISNLEFLTVYHDALLKAGWSIVNEFNSSDVAISAHYGLNGRNIWAYLHFTTSGYVLNVADASAGDDLAADLAKECHVALTGVLFDFNKSTLKPESDAILEKVSNLLVKNPSLKLEVQGHTDNVGGDTYNQTLSESRAAAVVDWLKRHGADGVRLSAKGYGKSKPIADNGNELGRAKNRRVEIVNPTCATKK
jgi:outer membrane protein OmpA-like peptidoglycan-associated protein